MCLGIPGRIVEMVDTPRGVVKADVNGVRRNISVALLQAEGSEPAPGDWVLIHVGFAMSIIDEYEAAQTYRWLEGVGQAYQDELAELERSEI
jgi:hydrogenase expression/formation protein HypC